MCGGQSSHQVSTRDEPPVLSNSCPRRSNVQVSPRAACPPYSCSKRSGLQPSPQPLVVAENARELQRSVVASVPNGVVATPSLPSAVAVPRWTWQQKASLHASKGVGDQSSATMKCDALSFSPDALVQKRLVIHLMTVFMTGERLVTLRCGCPHVTGQLSNKHLTADSSQQSSTTN